MNNLANCRQLARVRRYDNRTIRYYDLIRLPPLKVLTDYVLQATRWAGRDHATPESD
jgi:hypothetical protein